MRVDAAPPADPAGVDRTVWRALGAPLLPPLRSGPLDGLGVAVKDLFAVEGHAVGGGVPAFAAEGRSAARSAAVVDLLRSRGAAVVGIAQTDQFAYGLSGANPAFGTPPNPRLPDRLPGGSSSGPASAVAVGHADVGLGTDTAGSIRVPAAYQGLWGLRATHAALPVDGLLPLAPTFDAVGLLTRDGQTLLRVGTALLPAGAARPFAAAVRLPALDRLAEDPDAVPAALDALPDEPPVDLEEAFVAFRTVQAAEAWGVHGAWIEAHPDALGPEAAARFAAAAQVGAAEARAARDRVLDARSALRSWLGDRVLVLPTVASEPPRRVGPADRLERHRAATLRLCSVASLGGLPALAVPGPGTGFCLVAGPGRDLDLVRLALDVGTPT